MTEALLNPVNTEGCIALVRKVFELYPDEKFRKRVERGTRGFNVLHSRLSPGFVPVDVPSQEIIIDRLLAEKRPLREALDRLAGQPDRSKDLVPVVDVWLGNSNLTERERAVVELSFGIGSSGKSPMSLSAIGERFGVQGERIRQNLAKAKRKLRLLNNAKPLLDFLQDQKDLMGKSG